MLGFRPDELLKRETRAGTKYEIAKWVCRCKRSCSALYIDDQWCHGDDYMITFADGGEGGEALEWCRACWRGD